MRVSVPGLKIAIIAAAQVTGQTQKPPAISDISLDLLPTVQRDFGTASRAVRRCLESTGRAFDQFVRTKWLVLNASQRPALPVEALGPCLAGSGNGRKPIQARVGNDGRKISNLIRARQRRDRFGSYLAFGLLCF